MMGLFYKKATNKGAITGIITSIPFALALKTPSLEMPWMDQMLYTFLFTMAVIAFVSLATNRKDDDPKAIIVTNKLFKTDKVFSVASYGILIILVVLYTLFW
jgi:SSS family solute:Na+ symporter